MLSGGVNGGFFSKQRSKISKLKTMDKITITRYNYKVRQVYNYITAPNFFLSLLVLCTLECNEPFVYEWAWSTWTNLKHEPNKTNRNVLAQLALLLF
jgi:hypothetical protein